MTRGILIGINIERDHRSIMCYQLKLLLMLDERHGTNTNSRAREQGKYKATGIEELSEAQAND